MSPGEVRRRHQPRGHRDLRRPWRPGVDRRCADVRAPGLEDPLAVRVPVGEDALPERARARVIVADHDAVLAPLDRLDVGGGDLDVGAVEDRDRPRRTVVGKPGAGAFADRRAVWVLEQLGPAPLELVVLRGKQVWHLPQRREHLAEKRGQGTRATRADRLRDQPTAQLEASPAQPPRALQQRCKGGSELGDEAGTEVDVQVAHRVHVDGGATAASELRGASRRFANEFLEQAVEFVERRGELFPGSRRDPAPGSLEPGEAGLRPLARRGIGDRPNPDPCLLLRPRAKGQPGIVGDRLQEALEAPDLEMNAALADQRARALGQRRAGSTNLAPRERPEEPNRVVLRAVALPVAGDDLLALAPSARLDPVLQQAVGSGRERATVLPGQRLAKGRIAGDLTQPFRLVLRPEGVKTGDGKAGAADCEVAAQSPISGKRDQVVVHGAEPRSTASKTEPMSTTGVGPDRAHGRLPHLWLELRLDAVPGGQDDAADSGRRAHASAEPAAAMVRSAPFAR